MAWVRPFAAYNQPLLNVVPGDSSASPGMVEFSELIGEIHPGIFIHSVYIEEEQDQDRRAGFVRLAPFHRVTSGFAH